MFCSFEFSHIIIDDLLNVTVYEKLCNFPLSILLKTVKCSIHLFKSLQKMKYCPVQPCNYENPRYDKIRAHVKSHHKAYALENGFVKPENMEKFLASPEVKSCPRRVPGQPTEKKPRVRNPGPRRPKKAAAIPHTLPGLSTDKAIIHGLPLPGLTADKQAIFHGLNTVTEVKGEPGELVNLATIASAASAAGGLTNKRESA